MRRYQWCWLAAAAFQCSILCHVGRLGSSQTGGPEKQHRQHVGRVLLDRKRPDGRALCKGGRTQRARASSASSSCFPMEGRAESESCHHSLFFSVFGTTSEHHQHHRCLCAGPTTRKVMLRMLTLRTICHPASETDDADDACCLCSKAEGKRC